MVEVYKRDVYKTKKIVKAISTLYYDNRCVYGARRMYVILRNRGYRVSYSTVCTVCQNLGFISVSALTYNLDIKKPEKEYEKVGYNENKSCKAKIPSTINEVWVCDWTRFFVDYKDELKAIYVYGIMDLYSRRIVSYRVSYKGEDVNVQIEVLKNAIIQRNPLDTLTVHSDNGNSFKDEFYRKIIDTNLNLS